MKQEIQLFKNEQFGEIRVQIDENGQVWFMASEVAKALGYSNGRDAVAKHCEEGDVVKRDTPISNQYGAIVNQVCTFINESGLYSLVFGSKLEAAKIFKKWVTSEVLPSIRKTGQYSVNLPQDYLSALKALVKSEEEKQEAQKALEKSQEQKKLLVGEVKHRDELIEGLTEEIPLADMRQRLNDFMRRVKGYSYEGAWHFLYEEFNKKFHCNVWRRKNNSGFAGNTLDFIDKKMGQLPDLYELACTLFKGEYSALQKRWDSSLRAGRANVRFDKSQYE